MDMRTALTLAALLLLSGGCGDRTSTATDPGPTGPGSSAPGSSSSGPLVLVDGEVQVNCGGGATGWSPSAMASGVPGVVSEEEARQAFRDALADPRLEEELLLSGVFDPGPESVEWRVLTSSDETVTFGLGAWTADGPGPRSFVMTMERTADGFEWAGHGNCNLTPALSPDFSWVRLSRPEGGLDRSTSSPVVGVMEMECTGARDPAPYLQAPYVVETDESVTVYWTSEAPTGANTCQGNPATPQTLELAAPLGDRELRDGSVYPPAPVGPPMF